MPTREILYRFGTDISGFQSAFRQIADLFDSLSDKQQKDRDAEQRAVADYTDAIKEALDQLGAVSAELSKQVSSAKDIATSYQQLVIQAKNRLEYEMEITQQVERQRDAMAGVGAKQSRTPGLGAVTPGTRGTRPAGGSAAPQLAPEWQTAATRLRANMAQGNASPQQVTAQRANIIAMIDKQMDALQSTGDMTKSERASLQAMALERERQSNAQGGGPAVTVPTQQLLGAIGQVGGAAIGGEAGQLTSGAIGGMAAGGWAAGILLAVDALAKFVSEMRELISQSDAVENIQHTFQALSSGIGTAPIQFINDLKDATRGLVDETDLMSSANRVMLEGLPVTTDQITKLVGAISTLSVMQGKDATESFDMVTRALSSGRLSMLAYNTGLDEETRAQLRLAQSLPESTRGVAELNIVMDGAERQISRIGEPVDTLGTKLKQADVAWTNFMKHIADAISDDAGLKAFGDDLINIISFLDAHLPSITAGMDALGKTLLYGSGIGIPIKAVSALIGAGQSAYGTGKEIIKGTPPPTPTVPAPPRTYDTRGFHIEATSTDQLQEAAKLGPEYEKLATQAAQSQEKLATTAAGERFTIAKAEIDREQALYKASYDMGLVELSDYLDRQKELRERELAAELDRIDEETKAKQAARVAQTAAAQAVQDKNVRQYKNVGDVPPELALKQQQLTEHNAQQSAEIDAQANSDRLSAVEKFGAEYTNLNLQVDDSIVKSRLGGIEVELAATKAGYDQQLQALEYFYRENLISTQDYIDQKRLLVVQDFNASIAAAQLQLAKNPNATSPEAQAAFATAVINAQGAAAKQFQALNQTAPSLGAQGIQQQYGPQQALLQASLSLAAKATQGTDVTSAQQQTIIEKIVSSLEDENTALEALQATTTEALDPKQWLENQTEIQKNTEAIVQYNAELMKSKDLLTPSGAFFSEIGKALGILTGPGGQRAAGGFSQIGSMLTTISGIFAGVTSRQAASGGPTDNSVPTDTSAMATATAPPGGNAVKPLTGTTGGASASGGIENIFTAWKNFADDLNKGTTSVGDFTDALKTSVGAIALWAQVVQGRQGVAGGAISGAAAGLGVGQAGASIAHAAGASDAVGAAIEGAFGIVGSIIGAISAKMREKTQEMAQQITDSFNDVVAAIGIGTTNLAQGIAQTEQLRQQAIDQLSGQKGGQDQLNQILPQFNQEIAQLQAQQAQIFNTMDQTAQIMQTPQPFQQYLQQFQQIIQTYQNYVAAGGSVSEANQYLANSFAALQFQDVQQLLQGQQSAIQNAINYYDLLVQQQQLVLNTNQQIENVMAQGNVTRQAPTAMTKGLQIAEIQTQYNLQEQNLQQQIAVAQYQYQVQQQIFGLASTRVGLELQLTAVQEAQVNQSLVQIGALQSVVQMLTSAGAAGSGTLSSIEGALAGGQNTAAAVLAGMGSVLQLLGLGPGQVTGTQLQQVLAAMLAAIPGLNPPGTVAGIFGQPVQQPAQNPVPPLPGYDEGGIVPETGPAIVHAGELISTASDVSALGTAAMNRVAVENTILSAAQQRYQIELQIYNLRMQELSAMGGGSNDSTMLLSVYQGRGRMGLGGFSGELG